MGIYNINEKSKAVSLFRFLNIPPTIVDPLLLIPGRSATTWNRPITRASLKVISFPFFLPLKSLIKNKNKAVINKVRPTNFIFFSRKSKRPNLVTTSPIIPAGIVPITINQQYL